jgi:hypothetical protein
LNHLDLQKHYRHSTVLSQPQSEPIACPRRRSCIINEHDVMTLIRNVTTERRTFSILTIIAPKHNITKSRNHPVDPVGAKPKTLDSVA